MIDRVTLHYAAMRIASAENAIADLRAPWIAHDVEPMVLYEQTAISELRQILSVAEVPRAEVEREVRVAAFLLDARRALFWTRLKAAGSRS